LAAGERLGGLVEPDRGLGIHRGMRDTANSDRPLPLPLAPSGFEAFYGGEYGRAVRLAWLLVRSEAVADDITQEAFMALVQRFDTVDNPSGFVHRAVVNQARTWYRNERRNALKASRAGGELLVLPAGDAELFDLVGALPYRQRAVVVLRYWHGWSEQEIAEVLGCRPGTVKSLASRALRRLREELHDDDRD
jgi:DNA-directed RNA polymerase specialized sigma24 family protein